MTTETSNLVGQSLSGGRYRVTDKLGEGGMALVFRAHDRNLDTEVVLKVPKSAMLEDPDFAGRFSRETRLLVRLAHPHVIKILDVGEHEGCPFAVMQYLSGGSLADRFKSATGQQLSHPAASLARWLEQVAAALDFIHSQHHVHRDVKPDNILFDGDGHAFLSDFGIAKVLADAPGPRRTVMTRLGMVLGTGPYMAPEVLLGESYDGRADQYALAVTVYEILSGRVPFDGATPAAVLLQQTSAEIAPLHKLIPTLPTGLTQVVQKSLSRKPNERFASCMDFARAVASAVTAGKFDTAKNLRTEKGGHLQATCPGCGKTCQLPLAAAGKRLRCPDCQTFFVSAGPRGVVAKPPSGLSKVAAKTGTGSSKSAGQSSQLSADLPEREARPRTKPAEKADSETRSKNGAKTQADDRQKKTAKVAARGSPSFRARIILACSVSAAALLLVALLVKFASLPGPQTPRDDQDGSQAQSEGKTDRDNKGKIDALRKPRKKLTNAEGAKILAEQKKTEEAKILAEQKKADEAKILAEQRKADEAKILADQKKGIDLDKERDAAIKRGLDWLAKNQESDGKWSRNRGVANEVGATSFSVLSFLAAGKNHKDEPTVRNGLNALLRWQDKKTGSFSASHCLATIAICEAYGLTKDPQLRAPAQLAVDFIVNEQKVEGVVPKLMGPLAPGRWQRRQPGDSDTAAVGWQTMALKSAKMAGLNVPDATMRDAIPFLDGVCNPASEGYGNMAKLAPTPPMSAVGLLCRQYLQQWGPDNPRMIKGVENNLKTNPPGSLKNTYYYFHATQVMHNLGGQDWKDWNLRMRDALIATQTRDGAENGSWNHTDDPFDFYGGQLIQTCLSLLTLGIDLQRLPLFQREKIYEQKKADKTVVVVIETSMGKIKAELFADQAPITVGNFLQYVDDNFYDGTIFHRVIPTFMIQGGGMTSGLKEKKTRAPIKNEAGNGLSNKRGTLAMARTSVPDSATCQFFINVKDNDSLDRAKFNDGFGYAVFGNIVDGMDVVDAIKGVRTGANDVPVQDVIIKTIRRIAPPAADPPKNELETDLLPLFNGKDLQGWVNVNCPPEAFVAKDDKIIITAGEPVGYLRTDRQYENFVLEMEWFHVNTKAVGNSGLLIWCDPRPVSKKIGYTRGIEIQVLVNLELKGSTSHGDIFSIWGAKCKPDRPHPNGWERCLPSERHCKGGGEWNHYRVAANDGVIKLSVNGHEVSGVSQCNPRKGYLALEREGNECHFKNIKIKELPSTNPKPNEIAEVD